MRVERFEISDAALVAGWATPGAETRRWCGLDRVDADTVVAWAAATDVEACIGIDDRSPSPVAYGEVWFDEDEDEAELAHLIVPASARGRGIGRSFVESLVAKAHARHPVATLRVVPDNAPAIRCYAAAGFERAAPADEAAWNAGQPRAYVWMLRPR